MLCLFNSVMNEEFMFSLNSLCFGKMVVKQYDM